MLTIQIRPQEQIKVKNPIEYKYFSAKELRQYGKDKKDYNFTYLCYRNSLIEKARLLRSIPMPCESIMKRIEEITSEYGYISYEFNFPSIDNNIKYHTPGRKLKRHGNK